MSYRVHVVSNLPTCPVPVLMLYRIYPSVRYRYYNCTDFTRMSGIGMKVRIGTGGTGIHIVPNLTKRPEPVSPAVCLSTYRTEHPSSHAVQNRTEHTLADRRSSFGLGHGKTRFGSGLRSVAPRCLSRENADRTMTCLLYTSDAADE